MKKYQLKNIIKECISEILTEAVSVELTTDLTDWAKQVGAMKPYNGTNDYSVGAKFTGGKLIRDPQTGKEAVDFGDVEFPIGTYRILRHVKDKKRPSWSDIQRKKELGRIKRSSLASSQPDMNDIG